MPAWALQGALAGVLSSSISFFDTTPMGNYKPWFAQSPSEPFQGRVVSRLSKDMDTIDTQLPLILMQVSFVSVITISYIHPPGFSRRLPPLWAQWSWFSTLHTSTSYFCHWEFSTTLLQSIAGGLLLKQNVWIHSFCMVHTQASNHP